MRGLAPLLAVGFAAALVGACSLAISVDGLAGPALTEADDAAVPPEAGGDAPVAETGGDGPAVEVYRAAVLADAPLAYYRLDDPGDVVRDETGAHDGKVTGTLSHVGGALAGVSNRAARFDGASYVTIGNVLPFLGRATFSMEAWAKAEDPTGSSACMVAKNVPSDAGAVANGYSFFLESDTNKITMARFRDSTQQDAVGPVAVSGVFTHYVATYDGAILRLYLDGEKVAEHASDVDVIDLANPLTLGASRGGTYCYFHGALDEIAIYGQALAPDRIRAHHAAGQGR
jgi:hypothetical protein